MPALRTVCVRLFRRISKAPRLPVALVAVQAIALAFIGISTTFPAHASVSLVMKSPPAATADFLAPQAAPATDTGKAYASGIARAAALRHAVHVASVNHQAHLRLLAQQKAAAALRAAQARAAAAAKAAAASPPVAAHAPNSPPPPASGGTVSSSGCSDPSGYLTQSQVGMLWVCAGGPSWAESAAEAVAHCESNYYTRAYNPSGATGLWQILGAVVSGSLYDAHVNALNAVAKFKASGNSWAQWVCKP